MYSAPPPSGTGAKMCSLPPALGAWRIDGVGERSSGLLSHQMARPSFCDSISSGCCARNSRMNLVSSDSYMVLSLVDRDPGQVFRADVVRARTDDLAVGALLDDVRRPAARARDD